MAKKYVYIVFKHVLDWHKEMIVDSVWSTLFDASDRLEDIKEGGRIEKQELRMKR